MIRITIELFPFGDKSEAKELAQFNIANIGKDAHGLTKYLYSIQEPEPLQGDPIDISGIVKFKRQASTLSFLRKLLVTGDSGRELSDDELKMVEKMKKT